MKNPPSKMINFALPIASLEVTSCPPSVTTARSLPQRPRKFELDESFVLGVARAVGRVECGHARRVCRQPFGAGALKSLLPKQPFLFREELPPRQLFLDPGICRVQPGIGVEHVGGKIDHACLTSPIKPQTRLET